MRRSVILWIAALAVLLSMLSAADMSGKGKAEFRSADGQHLVNTFTFKADGANLTGTVAGSQDETPIQNGKISGDSVSFSAERPFGKFTYTGKVAGNEIKFKVEFGDQT